MSKLLTQKEKLHEFHDGFTGDPPRMASRLQPPVLKTSFRNRFGSTKLRYTGPQDFSNRNILLERSALRAFLRDAEGAASREKETAGFFVGTFESIPHITAYVKARGMSQQSDSIFFDDRIFSAQIRRLSNAGYDSLIHVHSHPATLGAGFSPPDLNFFATKFVKHTQKNKIKSAMAGALSLFNTSRTTLSELHVENWTFPVSGKAIGIKLRDKGRMLANQAETTQTLYYEIKLRPHAIN